jgi:hypothetical protein
MTPISCQFEGKTFMDLVVGMQRSRDVVHGQGGDVSCLVEASIWLVYKPLMFLRNPYLVFVIGARHC